MNNDRAEQIDQRIRAAARSTGRPQPPIGSIRRTVPGQVLAPVEVFVEDHLRKQTGGWLATASLHRAFGRWLSGIGQKGRIADYPPVVFGRCLSQVLGEAAGRRWVKNRLVRGFPVLATWQDGDEFFDASYE